MGLCLLVEVYNRIPHPLYPHPSSPPQPLVFPPCQLSVGVEEVWPVPVQGDRWPQQVLLVWSVFPLQALRKPSTVAPIVRQLVCRSPRRLETRSAKLWPQWVLLIQHLVGEESKLSFRKNWSTCTKHSAYVTMKEAGIKGAFGCDWFGI